VPFRLLDAQLPPGRLLRGRHGIDPDADIQIRVVPPRKWWPICRAGNIDGFLAPTPSTSARSTTRWLHPHPVQGHLNGHPCCAFGVPEAMIREGHNLRATVTAAVLTAAPNGATPSTAR